MLDYVRGGYAEVDPDSRQRLEDQGYIVENQGSGRNKLEILCQSADYADPRHSNDCCGDHDVCW